MTDPGRWTEGAAATDEERRAAKLLEGGRQTPGLSDEALARIERKVSTRLSAPRRMPLWIKAVFGVGLIGAGSLAFAAVQKFRRADTAPHAAVTAAAPVVAPAADVELDVHDGVYPHPGTGELPVQGEGNVIAPKRPARRVGEAEGALGREAAMIESAIVALRDSKDADAALVKLEEHSRAFPKGQLREEALRLKVEALEMKGRVDDALGAIAKALEVGTSNDLEWLLVDAEVRLRAGRCKEAIEGFTRAHAFSDSAMTAYDARALAGNALCYRRLGQEENAKSSAASYLQSFPKGRHAAQMKELLGDQ